MEEKGGGLQAEEQHPNRESRGWQHHAVGCFAAGGTGALHKIDGIRRQENYVNILEATSQDISQEVKAWLHMGLPIGQLPQAYFQSRGKMA